MSHIYIIRHQSYANDNERSKFTVPVQRQCSSYTKKRNRKDQAISKVKMEETTKHVPKNEQKRLTRNYQNYKKK